MGFGLDIKDKPLEVEDTDWVNYKGVYRRYDELKAIEKAWIARWKKTQKIKTFDLPSKNKVRSILINHIKNTDIKNPKILTLESPDYLFVSQLPKASYFIFERDLNIYLEMKKNKPQDINIFLHYGNLLDSLKIQDYFDIIYLDFCNTLNNNINLLKNLIPKIQFAKYFGITACLRKNKKNILIESHYLLDLEKNIKKIIPFNLELIYGDSYKDIHSPPMAIMFFRIYTDENFIIKEKICPSCLKRFTFDEYKNQYKNLKKLEDEYEKKDGHRWHRPYTDWRVKSSWKTRKYCWYCVKTMHSCGHLIEQYYIENLKRLNGGSK